MTAPKTDQEYFEELDRAREERHAAESSEMRRKDALAAELKAREELVEGWKDNPPPLFERHVQLARLKGLSEEDIERLRLEIHREVELGTTEFTRSTLFLRKAELFAAERSKTDDEKAIEVRHRFAALTRLQEDDIELVDIPGTVGGAVRRRLIDAKGLVLSAAMDIEAAAARAKKARLDAIESPTARNLRDELQDANLAIEIAGEKYAGLKEKYHLLVSALTTPEALKNYEMMEELLGQLGPEPLTESTEPALGEVTVAVSALCRAVANAKRVIDEKVELQKQLYSLDTRTGLRSVSRMVMGDIGTGVGSFLNMHLKSRLHAGLDADTKHLLLGDTRPISGRVDPMAGYL